MSARVEFVSRPTLFGRATRECPRCAGARVHGIAPSNLERVFDWYECRDCSHLWAVPYAPACPGVADDGR
jgi:hypothetical protein